MFNEILLIGDDRESILGVMEVENHLNKVFGVKDIGTLTLRIGMKVLRM